MDNADVERLTIDTIRGLAMDMVEQANAGHPGTAMALAPLGYLLFRRLRADPEDPDWPVATGSCSVRATRACCSTRCCT